ncbi:glycosyltransferase family 1 protein [Dokdonella sp.]|uniref:glycosyltransferase family 4 protein n=1 Tax=Dokdonella sp. TaxID=2291710 RepID=UPI001B00E259|nr:glycosyltransferase family 1 protein [Dokdonella sp.]MBO9663490.1 glycosyltransferase family 1 protein [Dokdonella sp.]
MRIAIVTETWPPEINGVALTVQALARGLAGLGHAIELVRPRQPEKAAETEQGFEQLLLPGASLPRYPGLRFGLPAHRSLHRHWSAQRPDVVYIATEGPLGLTALGAARRLGIAACTGFHTRFDDFAGHYGLGFLTPVVFAYLRRFHNRAAATLVPTTELATFLGEHGFRNVRLLRRAVDTTVFDPARRDDALRAAWGAAPDDLVVVHVGRLAPEKNLDLAVRAFRAIQQHRPRARFVVVGDGPARAGLAAQHPDLIFAGVHRGEDLGRHYASGDLFLFPSLTETFGNVTLEALASGVPVVAFDYGAAHEHIHEADAGTRVALGDEAAFVAAASDLAERVALAAAPLRRAARDAVATLSPTSVATHFADLLGDLAMRRAA